MRNIQRIMLIALMGISGVAYAQKEIPGQGQQKEKTAFQVAATWNAAYDVRSDIAIVYGINDAGGNFEERVKAWKDRGYTVHFMTGIAWGQYQDYFIGKYDGKTHFEDGQVERNGNTIWHGKDVPYIVPSASFLAYIKSHVKKAIDAGVSAIHLEEPEFWARAGYSESFKKEWQHYYGTPWVAQHESPEATYLSSKLKYQLYYNALKDVFAYVKEYARSVNKEVKCYVPTHSLINYSSWMIVSPEASLASIRDVDGYIAQVWTGTSREPVYYNGVKKERVFENAFLEYGSMVSMIQPTGKKVFFLTDPIEDWPRTWDDYKRNYQATFTAQLLYPMVADYEVMPWPNRIYLGKFRMENDTARQPMPAAYATQVQVMVNALNEMPVSSNRLNGSKGIGVLVSNSMMFQRFPQHKEYDDPSLSNFYGMAMPLLKKGIPVETVHMENLMHPNSLKQTKLLVMSYANMKPLSETYHTALNEWVRGGGVLLYYGEDKDPFQSVREWWNSDGRKFKTPSEHLFALFGIKEEQNKDWVKVGKGWVKIIRKDPKAIVIEKNNDQGFINEVSSGYALANAGRLSFKNNFLLERGPYIIASVLDENGMNEPLSIKGPMIDLFDPALPVVNAVSLRPGQQGFYYDLKQEGKNPSVLASASRVYEEKSIKNGYSFVVKSPINTMNVMRIKIMSKPVSIKVQQADGKTVEYKEEWDGASRTLLLRFANHHDGIKVEIQW